MIEFGQIMLKDNPADQLITAVRVLLEGEALGVRSENENGFLLHTDAVDPENERIKWIVPSVEQCLRAIDR